MRAVTAQEMIAIDREAIEERGIAGNKLMEEAGIAVVKRLLALSPKPKRIAIICGLGKNGGDGFFAARYLRKKRLPVSVYLLGEPQQIAPDAAAGFSAWKRAGGKTQSLG